MYILHAFSIFPYSSSSYRACPTRQYRASFRRIRLMADRQTSNLYVPVRFWYLAPCNQANVEAREAGQRVNVITASASEKTSGGLQPKAVSGPVKPGSTLCASQRCVPWGGRMVFRVYSASLTNVHRLRRTDDEIIMSDRSTHTQ